MDDGGREQRRQRTPATNTRWGNGLNRSARILTLLVSIGVGSLACDRPPTPASTALAPDEPSPSFRNVTTATAYVGDTSCTACHAAETAAYRQHAMSKSFHRWTAATRIEPTLETPLRHPRAGLSYTVIEVGHRLYQVEFLTGPDGRRIHELRRRIDHVMGSGTVARSYFTEENGRLFQLPLTWYRDHGWDFSPGYEINNARFDRLMPDRCIACHANYPATKPFLEGKPTELRPGIGCERCHGPGALHVAERRAGTARDSGYDRSIVNPARLPLQRRVDVCEQCHVHTAVAVLREGKDAFSYLPSQPLGDQWAYFKESGSIDVVSHADRLRQSACFIETRSATKPLECATCHNPHQPPPDTRASNQPCQSCHGPSVLAKRFAGSPALASHMPSSNCVSCHMPKVKERAVPHGSFTEHWIRVPERATSRTATTRADGPIEPYFARDRSGADAAVYRGMGGIVYASLANDGRALLGATTALQKSLERDTARAEAHFLLGVALQQLGKTDLAIAALERSVRVDSARPDPLRALAQAYERAGRSPATIEQVYRRALAAQPALAWIRAEYADFLQGQGRRDDAKREYRSALAEQPSLAVAWFNLGTVLADEGRLDESSAAFREAVHLDPSVAQALSPLLAVRTSDRSVTSVRVLDSPLPSLPVRERTLRSVKVAVDSTAGARVVSFLNVPAKGYVQILRPDGSIVKAMTAGDGSSVRWDLLTDAGVPVAGGLFRVRILGRDASGRPIPPQLFYLGIVRQRAG